MITIESLNASLNGRTTSEEDFVDFSTKEEERDDNVISDKANSVDRPDSKRVIWGLLFGMSFGDLLILNVAALLPTYVEQNFPEITFQQVGILMAAYPIMFLICSPIIGHFLYKVGRKNFVVFGQSMMALSAFVFGLA